MIGRRHETRSQGTREKFMRVVKKYSHLNGEEYLLIHHPNAYQQILDVIKKVKAEKSKISKEKTMKGRKLYNPNAMNKEFKKFFREKKWHEERYSYYVETDYSTVQEMIPLDIKEQKRHLLKKGIKHPILSYKQTDFVKDGIAVEVQFGKYAFVAYDLFVKHLLFYTGGVINVGIEILPVKSMQSNMSTGIAYYEGEVYNILRHGRNNPPVPLVVIGVSP